MKKVLLSLAAFSFLTAGHAQLLTYGFEEGETLPGIIVAENWDNEAHGSVFKNSTYNWESTEAPHAGARALAVHVDPTDCGEDGTSECGSWQRVIALTNTGFGENKSYRVSFWAKGSGKINVGLLKGCFDHDKAPYDITSTTTISGEYTKYSFNFWSPSREVMTAQKSDFADDVYWNQDFLRLSFLAAGDYNVDDIVIEESAVKQITFNANTVCVEYAYSNNITSLSANSVAELEGVVATVNVNGTDVAVKTAEAHVDGKLYLFLGEKELKKADVVKVTVSNAGPVVFSDGGNYEFSAEAKPATTFEGEAADHDASLIVTSFADAEPVLLSTVPVDGSFEIDPTTKEFSFTFDHVIDVAFDDLKAYLNEEELVVKSTESSKTVVFERTSTEDLAKGTHTLKIQGVATDMEYGMGTWGDATCAISNFEVGDIKLAETIYTDLFTTLLSGAGNAVPDNWTCYVKGDANNPWTGGEVWGGGSACRNLNVTGADGNEYTAFYLCDRDGYTYLQYGDSVNYITLPAGNIEFSVIALSHDDAGHQLEYRLEDFDGNVIASANGACSVIANSQFTSIEGSDYIPVQFTNAAEKNAILKIHALGGGYTAVRVLGFRARSYVETEGDKYESTIYFEDKTFGNCDDNCAPKNGSGWRLYQNGEQRTPGGNFNYNGTRIFSLGIKNMTTGYYTNGNWSNGTGNYVIYGEGGEYEADSTLMQEPLLTLPAGRVQITYYAANWKTNERILYFQLLNENGDVVSERADNIVMDPNMGGNRSASVETNRVQFFQNITAAGNYRIKFGGDGEMFVGNITIEKPGSNAALYHQKLNVALDEAKAELETCADDQYNGTTKTALTEAVAKYSKNPNGMHTPAEYDAAVKELETLTKALATRRITMATFLSDVAKLGEALASVVGTKYENLEIIPELQEFYNTYKEVNPSDLEDAELISAQAAIAEGADMISKLTAVINDLLTKQINTLLTDIANYSEYIAENEIALSWVSSGENALSDDQVVAGELQKILTACIYKKIAAGYNFSTVDEETEQNLADSLDITGYIANNMMYTTISANKSFTGETASAAFPGWNITEGTVSNIWWWENPLSITKATPAINASIRNTGSNAFKVNQVLNNLPAGTYTMSMKTADCSNIKDVSKTYEKKDSTLAWCNSVVYAFAGADSAKVEANYGEGQVWRNAASTLLTSIPSKLEEGAYTITMTIGADMNCTSDAAQVDDTYLYMTGTLAGFDYAAAADAILGSVNGIKEVADREDAPVSIVYYNLNGMQMEAAQGVNIVVERYADGYTVVKKIVK